jgi:hypothetical protein
MIETVGNEVCFTFAQYSALKDEILTSHVRWGSVCLVIGFVLASVFWWWRLRGIDKE